MSTTPLNAKSAAKLISHYFIKAKSKRRPDPCSETPLTSVSAMKRRREEMALLRSTSPLATNPPEHPIPFVLDDGDDDDDVIFNEDELKEVAEAVADPEDPLNEIEELPDGPHPRDDDTPLIEGRTFVFVEDKEELTYVASSVDRRPREEYITKPVWTREEIDDFLGNKLGFSPMEILGIIELSKEIFRLVARLQCELKSWKEGWITRIDFVSTNCFDYRLLKEKIHALHHLEKEPKQFLIMFMAPGSAVKFIASDMPAWMNVNEKQMAARLQFCPQNRSLKRVLYWANPTSDVQEPLRIFGDNRPVDIATHEATMERSDNIYTAFMERFWELEQLFTLPEFI